MNAGVATRIIVTVSLSNRNPWPANGLIHVKFADSMNPVSPVTGKALFGLDGELKVLVDGHKLTVNRTRGGSILPEGGTLVLALDSVTCPPVSGDSPGFVVRLLDSSGLVIDEALSIPGVYVSAGTLVHAFVAVSPAPLTAFSNQSTFFISFDFGQVTHSDMFNKQLALVHAALTRTGLTPSVLGLGCRAVGLPSEGSVAVELQFPSGFDVSKATLDLTRCDLAGGALALAATNNDTAPILVVTRRGGARIGPGRNVSLAVRGIRSSYAKGPGNLQVRTLQGGADGLPIEQALAVPGLEAGPSTLAVHSKALSSNVSGDDCELFLDIQISSGLGLRPGYAEVDPA
jgi:hypothetical protein